MTLKVLDHLELVCARTKEPLQKPTSCQGLPLAPDERDEERNEINGSPRTGPELFSPWHTIAALNLHFSIQIMILAYIPPGHFQFHFLDSTQEAPVRMVSGPRFSDSVDFLNSTLPLRPGRYQLKWLPAPVFVTPLTLFQEDAQSGSSKHSDRSSEEGGEAEDDPQRETGVEDLEPEAQEPKPKLQYPPSDSRCCGLLPLGIPTDFLCTPPRMSGRSAEAKYAQDFVKRNPLTKAAANPERESLPAWACEDTRRKLEPGEAEGHTALQQRFFADLDRFVQSAEDNLESATAARTPQADEEADEASGEAAHSKRSLSDALKSHRQGLRTDALQTHTSVIDAFAYLVQQGVLNVRGSPGLRKPVPDV